MKVPETETEKISSAPPQAAIDIDTYHGAASAPDMAANLIDTVDIETGLPLASSVPATIVVEDAYVYIPLSERYNSHFNNDNSLYDAIYVSDYDSHLHSLNTNYTVRPLSRPSQPRVQESQEPRRHIFSEEDKKHPMLCFFKGILIIALLPFLLLYNGAKALGPCLGRLWEYIRYKLAFFCEFTAYVVRRFFLCIYFSLLVPVYKFGVMAFRLLRYPLFYLGLYLSMFLDMVAYGLYKVGKALYDYILKPVYDGVVWIGLGIYRGASAVAKGVYEYILKPLHDIGTYIAHSISYVFSQIYVNIFKPVESIISRIGHTLADVLRSIGHLIADVLRSLRSMFRGR